MNLVEASPKQQVLDLVKKMVISQEQFSAYNETIEKNLAAGLPKAKEVGLQSELNRISEVYKKALEEHKANLKGQYDLGQKMIQQIEASEDLSKVPEILTIFQIAISPLLETHKKLQEEFGSLKGEILVLVPEESNFALEANLFGKSAE